jgi:hypothetical protein
MRGPIRITPLIWCLLAVATLTLTLGGCGASSAGQITTQPTATVVAPPLSGVKVPYLTGVSMASADEGWAVGSNGQRFHYDAGKVTRYETGAPCI